MDRHPARIPARSLRWGLLPAAVAVGLALTACTSTPAASPGSAAPSSPAASSPAASSPAASGEVSPGTGTPIHVVIDGQTLDGRIWDDAPGRDLLARLPLTLTFSDLSSQEKIGHLDQPLSMDGMPAGDDPIPGDIGWYAPWGNVVFYYGDVGYWDGIARIGTFDSPTDLFANQTGDFTATIELAN